MTITEWFQLALVILTILTIVGGAMMGIAKLYLDNRDGKILDELRGLMKDSIEPIQLQLRTQDGELARIGVRTQTIETKIDNGLLARQTRIEDKMDRMLEHYSWDGSERRQ